jgi:palmitoyltransferase
VFVQHAICRRNQKVWYLAIYIPDHELHLLQQIESEKVRLITYPRPASEQLQILEQSGGNTSLGAAEATPNQVPESADGPPAGVRRTFGIFATRAGEVPWDGGPMSNFTEVMGYHVWDWLLPVRPSPCTKHSSTESFYKVGRIVKHLREEAGIGYGNQTQKSVHSAKAGKHRRQRRHRRRRSRPHSRSHGHA